MLAVRTGDHLSAICLRGIIKAGTGIGISYSTMHKMLRDENLGSENPKKSGGCQVNPL